MLLTEEEKNRAASYPETVIDKYVAYCDLRSDAPQDFKIAGGLMILATLINNKLVLDTDSETLAANIWINLQAPPTIYRKTTTINYAKDIISKIIPDFNIVTSYEPQVLSEHLPQIRSPLLINERLESFTTRLHRLRNVSIPAIINHPHIYMFSETYKLTDTFTPRYIESGFIPRFIFIHGHQSGKGIKHGPLTDQIIKAKETIIHDYKRIYDFHEGETTGRPKTVMMDDEAIQKFRQLEEIFQRHSENSSMPDLSKLMLSGLLRSIKQCSLLIAVTKMNNDITVTSNDALKTITYAEPWYDYISNMIKSHFFAA